MRRSHVNHLAVHGHLRGPGNETAHLLCATRAILQENTAIFM